MQQILNNPYRVIGILAGTSLAAQTSHLNKLKMYLDAEQEPKVDFSFPVLGTLTRTVDSVNEAAAKISLNKDKLEAALFWFYNGDEINDGRAFDALKEADIQAAYDKWSIRTSSGTITESNASAFHNLSSLLFFNSLKGKTLNETYLKEGLNLKIEFLESDYFASFKNKVCDNIYQPSKKEVQLIFLNTLLDDLKKHKGDSTSLVIEILSKFSFSAKDDFFTTLTQKPIQQIEAKINTAKSKRKANKAQAANAGKELYNTVSDDVELLRKISGSNDLRFISISDKIADEILQCGIDYFNDSQEKDLSSDYTEVAIKLAEMADSLAVGRIVKERVKDSIKTLSEMKEQELNLAIEVLKSIKKAYEDRCKQIDKQVEDLQYDTIQLGGVPLKLHRPIETINWSKVEEMKRNALDWKKVADLINEAIPPKAIEKVKKTENTTKLNEYKMLVTFVMNKISSSYKYKIDYICYWQKSDPKQPTGEDFDFKKNAWWILSIAGVFVGALVGAFGGAVLFGIIGFVIGKQISK